VTKKFNEVSAHRQAEFVCRFVRSVSEVLLQLTQILGCAFASHHLVVPWHWHSLSTFWSSCFRSCWSGYLELTEWRTALSTDNFRRLPKTLFSQY